ncbi:hypothetical protein [Peribacillus butanolivorans]|uniref:hypothetical protein n=1 Tax=Peribacillus butanolivorans TaxID=421767 RepID=UPI00381B0768
MKQLGKQTKYDELLKMKRLLKRNYFDFKVGRDCTVTIKTYISLFKGYDSLSVDRKE